MKARSAASSFRAQTSKDRWHFVISIVDGGSKVVFLVSKNHTSGTTAQVKGFPPEKGRAPGAIACSDWIEGEGEEARFQAASVTSDVREFRGRSTTTM